MEITRPLFKLLGVCLGGEEVDIQKNAESHCHTYNWFISYIVPKKICLSFVAVPEE